MEISNLKRGIIMLFKSHVSGNNGSSMSSLQKLSVDKLFDIPNGENLESIPEYPSTLCTDFVTPGVQKVVDMQSVHTQDIQNESSIAKASNGPTPWSDKKESESDLKKYIKMVRTFISCGYEM